MKKIVVIALCIAGTVFSQRDRDPWIFKAVLPGKSRMVIVALDPNLVAVYDAVNCGLYMAWDGPVEDGNQTYGHRQDGSTYEPQGPLYHEQNDETVWSVKNGSTEVSSSVKFRGYTINGTLATLRYTVILESGAAIEIGEIPEFGTEGGNTRIVRDFTITGIPAGMSVSLKLDGGVMQESWEAIGIGSISTQGGSYLVQDVDGPTTVIGTWR
jgi:hypothetical protein